VWTGDAKDRSPQFQSLRDVAVVAGRKEETQAGLLELVLLDVIEHPAHARKVVSTHFNC
jgi:hypothetical protein